LAIDHFLQILEPCKELAMQLMELGLQHPPTRKLGMDMLRERGLHHDYVTAMLQDGYYLEALRYARKYKVLGFALICSFPLSPGNYYVLVHQITDTDARIGPGDHRAACPVP
jgi:hypothetical protein